MKFIVLRRNKKKENQKENMNDQENGLNYDSNKKTDTNEASTSKVNGSSSKRKRKTDFLYHPMDSYDNIKKSGKKFINSGLKRFKNINDKEILKPFINM